MAALLEVEGLSKTFGGLKAVQILDFSVSEGEIVGLIGPNGAGKSTAFNMICGSLRPSAGSIRFGGREIGGMGPSAVVQQGLARTFQSASVYATATVRENLFRGAIAKLDKSFAAQIICTPEYRKRLLELDERIDSILGITGLSALRGKIAGELAYGYQKRIGVAIGLATAPRMLLLDEPAAGLNAEECAQFGELLQRIRQEYSLTLLFVEHHMKLVMGTCERIVVMVQGRKIAEGDPDTIRSNRDVIEAYLGEEHAHA